MPIDMSAAPAPAKKRTPNTRAVTKSATTTKVETESLHQRRTNGILGAAQMVQAGCIMLGLKADAAAIGRFAGPIAPELANCAETSDVIAKPVDFLIEAGPYGALITTAIPLILQLLANHKVISASSLGGQGIVPPEVLEAQMDAEMLRLQAAAAQEQREAIRQAKEAQAAYEEAVNA